MREPLSEDKDLCFCPLDGLLEVISKKWSLLIIAILGNEGEKGFNELKRELGAISPRPLSDTLRDLKRNGLVNRTILPKPPPSMRYALTDDGRELREHLVPILVWVAERGGERMPGCPIRAGNHPRQ